MNPYWVLLAMAITASVGGQSLLKAGSARPDVMAQIFDIRTMAGLVLYGGAALCYLLALRRIPMSVALPCTAVSYVAAMMIGHFGFGEPLGLQHIAALAMICSGVVLLALA